MTDRFIRYNSNLTRLDRISAEIYGDDTYGWLILLSNPGYFIEFDIPTNTVIRIPYPLEEVLMEFQDKIIDNRNK